MSSKRSFVFSLVLLEFAAYAHAQCFTNAFRSEFDLYTSPPDGQNFEVHTFVNQCPSAPGKPVRMSISALADLGCNLLDQPNCSVEPTTKYIEVQVNGHKLTSANASNAPFDGRFFRLWAGDNPYQYEYGRSPCDADSVFSVNNHMVTISSTQWNAWLSENSGTIVIAIGAFGTMRELTDYCCEVDPNCSVCYTCGSRTYSSVRVSYLACENDAACDDQVACNGVESCANNLCVGGTPTCSGATPYCNEVLDECVGCLSLPHCDDADPCTVDRCVDNICVHTSAGSRVYVRDGASILGSGQAWSTAMPFLQDALALARDCPGTVNEIWVAEGTYYPDLDASMSHTGDRERTLEMVSSVAVYGGFAGTETSLAQRDYAANVTTLSGNIGSLSIDTDNSKHVVSFITAVAPRPRRDHESLTKRC